MSDEHGSGDRSPRAKVRLTPPPRVPAGPAAPQNDRERRLSWGGLAIVGALVLAGGAALFVGRPRVAHVSEPPATASPASVVSTPVAPEANVSPDLAVSSEAAEGSPPARPPRREAATSPATEAPPPPDPFLAAMSEGHRALDAGDWSGAKVAFGRAEGLRPGGAQDGLARALEGERLAAVEARRRRGAELEAVEDWRGAAAEYEAALKLDPALAFALDGYGRSSERARLQERLDRHLAAPQRLSAGAVGDEAERLLQRVRELQPPPPGLERRAALLERRLAEARTGVRVELRSDGLTEVTVLRVGRLGGFKQREVELPPGAYTIVGTRKGYRDVRRQVVIETGRDPGPIDVRCVETL